jgi:DNA-binding MurR/RpiR family transcriptional regulator
MSQASTFEEFSDAVAQAYTTLSKQQQQIARFVLEHPDDLALGTAASVADAASVQPSALVRFANVLGFGGFTDLQQVFRNRLLERSSTYRDRIDAIRRTKATSASGAGVLHQFVSEGTAELNRLEENVRPADLSLAAQLMCQAAKVNMLAQRRSFPVACYLSYALAQLDVKVQLLDGVGGMLGDGLRQIGTDEVLVVASFQNYSRDVIDAAEAAHARGVPVIAITDFALSPLKPHARICFELGQAADTPFRSLVGPMCLAQALVVSVGHRLVASSPAEARTSRSKRVASGGKRNSPNGTKT